MPIDTYLDVIALVRTRLTGRDDDFLVLLQDKTNPELISLLSHTAMFAAFTIQEFIEKMSQMCEVLGVQVQDETAVTYLDSVVKEVIASQSDAVD